MVSAGIEFSFAPLNDFDHQNAFIKHGNGHSFSFNTNGANIRHF